MHRPHLLVSSLVACLALASCGSSTPTLTPSERAAAARGGMDPAAQPGGIPLIGPGKIKLLNIDFHPAATTVKVGQTVTWVNSDSVVHTVTATQGAHFDSGDLPSANKFTFTPTQPGTIHYECMIHPNMKGVLTVTR